MTNTASPLMPEIDELLLASLTAKKDEVVAYLKVLDKAIKGMKEGNYSALLNNDAPITSIEMVEVKAPQLTYAPFPLKADIKVQILTIIDTIGKACKLKQIQDEFTRITNSKVSVRESVRTLHKAGKLLLMREADATRGNYWVKKDWVEDGVLLPQYKFEGFNLLYNDSRIEYVEA